MLLSPDSPSPSLHHNLCPPFTLLPESQSNPSTAPFVVWLTGGPGCSSTLALLTENGPCTVDSDGINTSPNPYSWNKEANVLWLDQPAGVGFSYGQENDATEEMVSEDAYYFLQSFFQSHSEVRSIKSRGRSH